MTRVKIRSNPYQKEILFYAWNKNMENWDAITYEKNPKSKLISDRIAHSFFTFQVSEIVSILFEEYDDGDTFEIEFEGPVDEFEELCYLISESDVSEIRHIQLFQSSRRLENAVDILPQVIEIFNQTTNIIPESLKNDEEIRKFKEASGKTIPLVVIGNYSSGKSSFINSLIGYDILPNSDSPITAKIISVIKSFDNQVRITFQVEGETVCVEVYPDGYSILCEEEIKQKLFHELDEKISRLEIRSFEGIANIILTILNQAESDGLVSEMSDIISIELPFRNGILSTSPHRYVLFDTPGSNSSSNVDHLAILQSAMNNMSNGLLLFVTEMTSLDTVDNVKLFDELKGMEGIDSRFSMIIVNKADIADFSDFQPKQILQQAIPKKLFSEGIFFVSSVMGLASKNKGQFLDGNYDRIFKRSLNEFSDQNNEYYQQLYQHNILPLQLMSRSRKEARNESDNLLYVNSGLFSIESDINRFASRYSAYNKCQQSKYYLETIIQKTNVEIQELEARISAEVADLYEQFEKNKTHLVEAVCSLNSQQLHQFNQNFISVIENRKMSLSKGMQKDELSTLCKELYRAAKIESKLDDLEEEVQLSQHNVWRNIRKNVKRLADTKDVLQYTKTLYDDAKRDIQVSFSDAADFKEKKKEVFDVVSNHILMEISERFRKQAEESRSILYECSTNYWQDKSEQLKRILSETIGRSEALPLEKREDIQLLISEYDGLEFELSQEKLFHRKHLVKAFQLGELVILVNQHKLDFGKTSKAYNTKLMRHLEEVVTSIRESHQLDFKNWSDNLVSIICDNIVDFSPNLKEENKAILKKENDIQDYKDKLIQLIASSNEMKQLLSFKE